MANKIAQELREETDNINTSLKECLAVVSQLDRVLFKLSSSPSRRRQALVACFSRMHELVHNADIQIAKAGERLINEAALSELQELTKKGAA